jgi:hypothetical protein
MRQNLIDVESLNSDGQQFCQYQKMNNHLSPQTIENKMTMPYGIGIPDSGLGENQKCIYS